jgi:hypothetical protein
MRLAPTLDEFSAMRPLVDITEERMAAKRGQTLEQYRAAKAAEPITPPRKP